VEGILRIVLRNNLPLEEKEDPTARGHTRFSTRRGGKINFRMGGKFGVLLGLGVYSASWLSLVVLLVPITAAVVNRIVKEEAVLLAALGAPYAEYCARTKRLIPGLL